MIRTYLKMIMIMFIAYQATECSLWENLKNNIQHSIPITLFISSGIAGLTYYQLPNNLPYPGETMLLFGGLLAILKPLSDWKKMPLFPGLKNNEIFINYQYSFTLAFLGAALAVLAYHNFPPAL